MITIHNKQRKIALDISEIQKDVQKMLMLLGYADFDLGILFTTPAIIKSFNQSYRGKDKPTDILSFAFYPDQKAGKRIIAHTAEEMNLGDLVICPAYVFQDYPDEAFSDRVKELLVHGILHLLGYDHERDEDYRKMHRKELGILKKLSASSEYLS